MWQEERALKVIMLEIKYIGLEVTMLLSFSAYWSVPLMTIREQKVYPVMRPEERRTGPR